MQLKKKRTQLSANPNCWVLHSRTSQSRRALSFSTELITTHKRNNVYSLYVFFLPWFLYMVSWNKKVQVLAAQSCPTPCDPMGCSPPGSPVHGILQARILEWWAVPFSRGSSWPGDWNGIFPHFGWILYHLSYPSPATHQLPNFTFMLIKILRNNKIYSTLYCTKILLLLLSHFSRVRLCVTPGTKILVFSICFAHWLGVRQKREEAEEKRE